MEAITNQFLAGISMARLARAVQGLADGTLHVELQGQDEGAVWGQVKNGDGKCYRAQVAHGYASCSCPDWAYRHTNGLEACKHALALALVAARQAREERRVITDHSITVEITLRHPGCGADRFGFTYSLTLSGFWQEHGSGRLWQEMTNGKASDATKQTADLQDPNAPF